MIAKALVEIQKKVEPLVKSAKNSHFSNTYVPLEEVMPTALELVTAQGMAFTQWPVSRDDATYLITILTHESGASIQAEQKLRVAQNNSQAEGSAITYARRYGVMSILGLVGEDDDDGNRASNRRTKPTEEQLAEIKQLCHDLKFPPADVELRINSLKSEDQATLAINNLHEIVSQRAAKVRGEAKSVKVFTADSPAETPTATGTGASAKDQTILDLSERLRGLGLPDERIKELVQSQTGRASLKICNEDQLRDLSVVVSEIENGGRRLPEDWYDPSITAPEPSA
ncbi:ERF family protein [Nocardia sp. NPDC050697]|uniref:ERF family protein n=1 Tax=Nocardia sp. NPDC050697 TaxID=3155158 RepID=UPI0033CA8F71